MMSKEKYSIYFCIIILLLAFVIGFTVTPDYGIPPDENTEIGILMGNVREYLSLYFDKDSRVMYNFDEQGYIPISQSIEIDHGQAAYYPLSPLIYMAKTGAIEMSQGTISLIYHYYTYIICFCAVIATFVIVNELFENRKLALICALLLLVSPRIFGEMHYNNKDVVLFSLLTVSCCMGMLAIKYCKPHYVFLVSLFAAVTANTKIIGLYAYGVIGICFIIYVTVNRQWKDRRRIWAVISSIFMFCVFYFLLTPAMWSNICDFFEYCLFNTFQFSRWNGKVLFEGELLSPSAGELPGRYLIKLIFMTTPIFILLLSLLGAGRLIYNFTAKNRILLHFEQLLFIAMVCICTLIPLIVASLTKSIVYNGWRHFYFSYFGFLMLAYYGLELLIRRLKKIIVPTIIAFISFTALMMGMNHPYEFAYFNILAGRDAEYMYETDFWGVSTKDALLLVLEDNKDEPLTHISWGADSTRLLLINAYNILPEDEAVKIDLVYDYESADYIIENTTMGITYDTQIPEGFELLTTIESYGNSLTDIYVRMEN